MKLFFVLAVATSTMLLVQGAPQITSEQVGKVVEQLKEMITSEIQAAEAESSWHGQESQSAQYPQKQIQSAYHGGYYVSIAAN